MNKGGVAYKKSNNICDKSRCCINHLHNPHFWNKLDCKRLVYLIKREDGFIDDVLIGWASIFMLIMLIVILSNIFVARQKAVATHMWFGEAMKFAAQAANQDGDIDMVALRRTDAEKFFKNVFAQMVEGTLSSEAITPSDDNYFPGSITIINFETVSPGDSVPGGTARQPGYMADINVPVFKGNFPFVGEKLFIVPMKYYAVVNSSQSN